MSRDVITVPVSQIRLSQFNTRKTRPDADVAALADRIRVNGFEPSRAPWVYQVVGGYEVFAGGTRVAAAELAGIPEIPVLLHSGLSEDEISRLADEDNENDEHHRPVPPVDTWAEYHRLARLCGWQQKRIAEAKRVDEATVSLRVKLHETLPAVARDAASSGLLDEGHLVAVIGVTLDVQSLSPWLTTEQAQTELVEEVLERHRGQTAGIKPPVKRVRETARRWKAMIAFTEETFTKLAEPWATRFVDHLVARAARTEAQITECLGLILRAQAEAGVAVAEDDVVHVRQVESIVERVLLGDARQLMAKAPSGFHLLLTDPPYGVAYHHGSRRKTSGAKKHIEADDALDAALELLTEVARAAYPLMAPNAHALVFTGWRFEHEFRKAMSAAGFKLQQSLVWAKNNHGIGNTKTTFAPKHERILYFIKGTPEIYKRHPDLLPGHDKQNSEHPTEKPRDLLRALIEATTMEGHVVVDPFAGSGSTLLEARKMGRDFWGVEIDSAYHSGIVDSMVHEAGLARQDEEAA